MENTEAFLTALKSNSERDLELLAPLNKTNLEGDSSADLTITCGSASRGEANTENSII